MAAPAPAGTRVVVLDDALAPLPVAVAELGLPFAWRVGPAAEPHGAPSFAAATFAASGRGLRPFPVAHVAQPFRAARLLLPWMAAAQAQKHVTFNAAVRLLDCLVQLAVLDADRAAPRHPPPPPTATATSSPPARPAPGPAGTARSPTTSTTPGCG